MTIYQLDYLPDNIKNDLNFVKNNLFLLMKCQKTKKLMSFYFNHF